MGAMPDAKQYGTLLWGKTLQKRYGMRILGLDYGDSRIGVAVSDPMGWTAQGLKTIRNKGNKHVIDELAKIIDQYDVEKIVLGLPKNMDGSLGERAERTILFKAVLENKLDIMVEEGDERLTTAAADRTMIETGLKRSKKKGMVDKLSAIYILQGYLDRYKKDRPLDL